MKIAMDEMANYVVKNIHKP